MPVQPEEDPIAIQPDAEKMQLYVLDKKVKMLQLNKKNLKKMQLRSALALVY